MMSFFFSILTIILAWDHERSLASICIQPLYYI
jgi:hypothetical protein